MKCVFGVDVGGTDIKIGKFYNMQLISKKTIRTKPLDDDTIFEDIYKAIDDLCGYDELIGVGFGVPGPVVKGTVMGAVNLGWTKVNLEDKIKQDTKLRAVSIMNETNAAALGEMAVGAAGNYKNFIFVTIGSGIGGAIIINQKVVIGGSGAAGELGHSHVQGDGRVCRCGLTDCVECYAGTVGIVRSANERRIGADTKLNVHEELTAKNIFDDAKAGDKLANDVIDEAVDKLAVVLAEAANLVNPDAIIIGGGVSNAGDYILKKIEAKTKAYTFEYARNMDFKLATLGNDAGIYGCAYSALVKVNEL